MPGASRLYIQGGRYNEIKASRERIEESEMDGKHRGRERDVCDDDQGKLWYKVKGREVIGGNGSYQLREPPVAYKSILGYENGGLRLENTDFWEDNL